MDAERRDVSIADCQNSPAAHSCVLLQRLRFQCSGMRAVPCTEMPDCLSELRHFLEQVDRRLCWVSIKKQAQSSRLICTGSQRGPPLIACPVSESCLLSGLLEDVETIITGSVIVVLIQLLLWKSVGSFCVSLWELSQILHQHIFGAVSLDHGNA